MNTYPPIFIADNYRHWPERPNAQHVVDYFLNEIPMEADGTQGLGVTINLAARAGWTEIVRKHIEKDPLSVHQRGWIGDTPLHWPCHNGHTDIVTMLTRLLLEAGADPTIKHLGKTALQIAKGKKNDKVTAVLEEA